MNKITLFLSGSVKKGNTDLRSEEYFWSSKQEEQLQNAFPGVEVEILNPNTISIPKHQMKERYQADIDMLMRSQAVVVDARTKKGLGVGAEMVIAKQAGIPVLTLCPAGSEYRGTIADSGGAHREWVHPFVSELSTQVFDDLESLIDWIDANLIKKL